MVRKFGIIVLGLFVLSGCGLYSFGPSLNDRLTPGIEPGDHWSVRVSYWPERFGNPYVETDTPLRSVSHYSVLDRKGNAAGRRILIENTSDTLLMTLNPAGNISSVDRIVSRKPSGLVKTQEVLSNKLQGRAFFDPNWSPADSVFLFHPDMVMNGSRARLRFDRGSNRSGDWVTQTVKSEGSYFRITLRHKPSRSRVVFDWRAGDPWWEQARWYRSERLIALAKRVGKGPSKR